MKRKKSFGGDDERDGGGHKERKSDRSGADLEGTTRGMEGDKEREGVVEVGLAAT